MTTRITFAIKITIRTAAVIPAFTTIMNNITAIFFIFKAISNRTTAINARHSGIIRTLPVNLIRFKSSHIIFSSIIYYDN